VALFENLLDYLRHRAALGKQTHSPARALANRDIAVQFAAGGAVSGADPPSTVRFPCGTPPPQIAQSA
jgi:hypothetical protein